MYSLKGTKSFIPLWDRSFFDVRGTIILADSGPEGKKVYMFSESSLAGNK